MQIVVQNEVMQFIDKKTIETKWSEKQLIKKAGDACYEAIIKELKNEFNKNYKKLKIVVVCGKGNNGEDGKIIYENLINNNFYADLFLVVENKKIDFENYDVIIDAIFGTGFKGKIKQPYKTIIQNINKSNKFVISIDINSGLNGSNGLCSDCVVSNLTIAIGQLKAGLFLNKAKDKIKKITTVDIDLIPIQQLEKKYKKEIKYSYLIEKKDIKKSFNERLNFSNKGTYGYIAIIAGSNKYAGALKLSALAEASIRSGCGVCKIAFPSSLQKYIQRFIIEEVASPLSENKGLIKYKKKEIVDLIHNVRTIAIGMGLGESEDIKKLIKHILLNPEDANEFVVIDADGLNTLSKMDLNILKKTRLKVVLTPHIKEFERLVNNKKLNVKNIQEDLINIAENFAKEYNVVLLLKGPTTIVTNGLRTYLVNSGDAGMATAGSGDVLAGIITARLYAETEDHLFNVATSAYINGLAGEIAAKNVGQVSMIARDTVNSIKDAIKILMES